MTPKITKLYPLGFQVFFEMENPKYPENMPQYAPMVYLRRNPPPFSGVPKSTNGPNVEGPKGLAAASKDHYHGWSGFGCMMNTAGTACQTGYGGSAIGAQFILCIMVILWSGSLSAIIFLLLKLTGTLRISDGVENVGMDEHHHSPPKAYSLNAWESFKLA